jgi:glucokinase
MPNQNIDEIIVADIGGTHARFAIARIEQGRVVALDDQRTLKSADHPSLQIAWESYAEDIGRSLPKDGAIAVAGPVQGDVIYFTNSSWMIRPALIREKLGLNRHVLINDFGAVGHAAAQMDTGHFTHICGPKEPLTQNGTISVIGPGTGLGVAHILRRDGNYFVNETEGGHIDFAPLDAIEDRMLAHLREQHRRVSVERVVSGPGLRVIHGVLAEMQGQSATELSDKDLWTLALSGQDSLASAALDHFCLCLGAVTGDLALAQGAKSVVLAGGVGARIAGHLPSSGFRERFVAKGRFQSLMEGISVWQLTYEEPGLYGAAAAFLKDFPA